MNLEDQRKIILTGAMYNDLTPELVKARELTVFLTNEYNASFGKPQEVREEILRRLLKSVGNNVHFEPTFRCEFGDNISIGDDFYANFDCVMLDGGEIEIGSHVLLGPRVGLYTSNHAIDSWERINGACYAMIEAFPEPPTLKQMSELSGVTHQSMRQIVDRLVDKGFLEIVPDKKDKRAIRLVKTEAANNIRTKKSDQNIQFVYKLFDCLTEEEQRVYCTALEKLCNRLNELKEENDA